MKESYFNEIKNRIKELFDRLTFETEHASRFTGGVHIISGNLKYDVPFVWSYTGYENYNDKVRSVTYRLDFKNDLYTIVSKFKSAERVLDFEKTVTYSTFNEFASNCPCETLAPLKRIEIMR